MYVRGSSTCVVSMMLCTVGACELYYPRILLNSARSLTWLSQQREKRSTGTFHTWRNGTWMPGVWASSLDLWCQIQIFFNTFSFIFKICAFWLFAFLCVRFSLFFFNIKTCFSSNFWLWLPFYSVICMLLFERHSIKHRKCCFPPAYLYPHEETFYFSQNICMAYSHQIFTYKAAQGSVF